MRTERDLKNQIAYAKEEGLKLGREEGREEGREQGREQERARIIEELRKQGVSEDIIFRIACKE